jgi:lipopolysaccharide export system permease protein
MAMTFFISLFILVMQGLWRYVDDIVGKGLEISVMAELLFYVALQVVPMALPLAILLAALMTFGNLGENYELTAMKASGISLWRIMKPLVVVTFFISVSAFWFSNNVLPVANLKFYTLLYSVRHARPELELKEKVYYDGVDGFRIKIDHKDRQTGTLYDVIIHDHRDGINRNVNVTMADSGRMDIDDTAGIVRLVLYSGVTYDEKVALNTKRLTERERQMYRHDIFSKEVFQIRVDGLDFSRISEEGFKTNDRMKDLTQLFHDEDSLQMSCDSITNAIHTNAKSYVMRRSRSRFASDSAYAVVLDTSNVVALSSLSSPLTPRKIQTAVQTALRTARLNKQVVDEKRYIYESERIKTNRHGMEIHKKFTLTAACLLFFFVGAPLGGIIRKGGLGMPIVISVLFFIFYYIIDTFGCKMARESVWPVWCGVWLSSGVLGAIGAFLTYKAATDSSLFKTEAYTRIADKVKMWIIKRREAKKQKDSSEN